MSNELQSGVNNKPHLWLLLDCEDLGIQTRIEQEGSERSGNTIAWRTISLKVLNAEAGGKVCRVRRLQWLLLPTGGKLRARPGPPPQNLAASCVL